MDEVKNGHVDNIDTESMKEQQKCATVESVFSPLLRVMKWVACYSQYWELAPGDRRASTRIHFLVCLITIVYSWFDVVRYLAVFRSVTDVSGFSMVTISFAIFNVAHAFSITALFFAGSKNMKQLITNFVAYHSDYGNEFSVVFLRRLVLLILILSSVTISTTAVLVIGLTLMDYFEDDSVFGYFLAPFTTNSTLGIIILAVSTISKTCSSFSMVGLTLIYSLSVFVLFRDYRKLSRDFGISCISRKQSIADDFDTLSCRHRALTESLETANHLLGHFVFGTYGMAIPNFCLLLFGVVMGNLPMQDIIGLVGIFIMMTVGIVLVTWSGIKLSGKVSELMHSQYCKF